MFVNLLDLYKAKSHKYTHKRRVYIKGKPAWRYFYKEHHGGGVTNVKDIKEGEAFKVKYKGKEGHFKVLNVEGDKVTVVHDETGKETTLSKSELRQVLLKTHATALKENVEKKKQTLAKRKSAKAKERAQQALDRAKSKIDGLEDEPPKKKQKTDVERALKTLSEFDTTELKTDALRSYNIIAPQGDRQQKNSIFDTLEDKKKTLHDKNFVGFGGFNLKNYDSLDTIKNDLSSLKFLKSNRFNLSGMPWENKKYRNMLPDDIINEVLQEYKNIKDVRRDGDLKTRLKKIATELYEHKIKQFEKQFDMNTQKKDVLESLEEDSRTVIEKNYQKHLNLIKNDIPEKTGDALQVLIETGIDKHKKDIKNMSLYYNDELDKLTNNYKKLYRKKGYISNVIKENENKTYTLDGGNTYHNTFSFNAKVEGRANRKLIAKIFNESMDEVINEESVKNTFS